METGLVFTPAAVLELLSKIDELQEYDISLAESLDGGLQLTVGESVYEISDESAQDVEVADVVVEEIDNINETAYEDLLEDNNYDSIESGFIKEALKTLLVGGLVRLTGKLLKG